MKVLVIVSNFAKSSCTRDYDNEWIHDQLTEIFFRREGMEKTSKVVIEELALEGPYGASWSRVAELVRSRSESCFILPVTDDILLSVREALVNAGILSKGRGENWVLTDSNIRYQILGVAALPIIYETTQYMRLLELIARGRGAGAWSFNLSSAVNVDAKQLFHLTNPLVDYGVVYRKSNITIPRRFKAQSTMSGSTATMFIHSRFASSSTDAELSQIVENLDSSDSVEALILTLLRESGGVMTAQTLRRNVVVVAGYLQKQYQKGRQRLMEVGRVETVYIPNRPDDKQEDLSDIDDEETEDKKKVALGLVRAYKLVDQNEQILAQAEVVKEDPSPPATPEESEEDQETIDQSAVPALRVRMAARNLLKANYSFPDSIRMVIKTSGTEGVTTGDIARITGIASKEIAKVLEYIRNDANIFCEWKSEGRKKFIVYKWTASGRHDQVVELKDEDDDDGNNIVNPTPTPPLTPMSALSGGSGYVTAATVRRSGYIAEIVSSRGGAMSLIDLGRAIEAKEMAEGIGIPKTSIDRRTLKKMCDIANFPIIEKTEFNSQLPTNTTKLMIVYDPNLLTPEQAAKRVDRPLGLVPKPESVEVAPISGNQLEPQKIYFSNIQDIHRRSRLAAIAVFGDEQSAKVPVSVQVATIYGYITADIYKARIMHAFLVSAGKFTQKFRLQYLINDMDLLMYLKVLGCGVLSPEIDSGFNEDNEMNVLSMRIADIESLRPSLRSHLRSSVMGGHGTESSHLSRILLPLVRLGLLHVDKEGYMLSKTATVEGIPTVGESVEIDVSNLDGVEEYWRVLHRYCSMCRHIGPPVDSSSIYHMFPGLLKMSQWRSKVVVSLAQRRALEKLLRSIIQMQSNIVVDGSNEELVRVCVEVKLEVAVALKALSGLLKVIGDERAKQRIVFAHVMQARFCCHVCGKIFYQFHSVKAHYQSVHGALDVPEDKETYTRQEYMEAVEKLRRGPVAGKRKGRRKRRSRVQHRSSTGVGSSTREDETFEEFENLQEERDWKESVELAKKFGGTNIGRDQLWRLVAQIRGIERVPEMIVRKLTREAPPAPQVVVPLIGSSIPISGQYKVIANMLVFNRVVVDSDLGVLQKILSDHKMEVEMVMIQLRQMHADGLLAIERSVRSMMSSSASFESPLMSKTYTPSRVLKTKLFGKNVEIDKFIKMFLDRGEIAGIVESEEAIDGMANAQYISRELYFDLGSGGNEEMGQDEEENDEDEEEEDENVTSKQSGSYTGIRKHLALSRDTIGGEISRVEIGDDKRMKGVVDSLQEGFFRHLVHHFGSSNIWRPTKTESDPTTELEEEMFDFDEPKDLDDLGNRLGVSEMTVEKILHAIDQLESCSPEMIRLLEILQLVIVSGDGQVLSVSRMNPDVVWFPFCGREISNFGRLLSSLDLRWYSFYFSPWSAEGGLARIREACGVDSKPRMQIASFTSVDGMVNEQLIRDIMINVLFNIYSSPGLVAEDLFDRLGCVVTVTEVDLILSTLCQLKLVYQDDDRQWFMEPTSNW